MILIPEHPIFTRDENGQKCSFDLRRFNEDLGEAFRLNGVKDSWLVEQFSVSVEEKLRTETMHSTPLSENEIDMLLISILTASGFSDVASSYSELRGSNPMRGFMAGLAPWDDTRLARTLTRCLPLTPKQVAKFVPACHDALEQLHMTSISDAFIVELAIHLAHDDNSKGIREKMPNGIEAPEGKNLCTSEQLKEEAPEFTRMLLDENVLGILPTAKLFPLAEVFFSMQDYCRVFTDSWPSELAIAGSMGKVSKAVIDLLSSYRESIASVFPNLADSSSYIFFAHYNAFIEQSCESTSKTVRIAFDNAIRNILSNYLVKRAPFDLRLKYR